MAGKKISASDAVDWGLVDQISTPEELIDDAVRLTESVRAADAKHVGGIKRMIGG